MRMPARHSLRFRLVILFVLISLLTLAAATAVLVRNDLSMLRESMGRDIKILAEVIRENSRSALAFEVPESARKNLESLRREYQVRYAALYDADGALFAVYRRDNEERDPSPPERAKLTEGVEFHSQHDWGPSDEAEIIHLIRVDGEPVGAIRIRAHMEEFHLHLGRYALLIGILFAATLAVAVPVSLYLQRFVSQPVLALADRTAAITKSGDYSMPVRSIPRARPRPVRRGRHPLRRVRRHARTYCRARA